VPGFGQEPLAKPLIIPSPDEFSPRARGGTFCSQLFTENLANSSKHRYMPPGS